MAEVRSEAVDALCKMVEPGDPAPLGKLFKGLESRGRVEGDLQGYVGLRGVMWGYITGLGV